MVKSKNKNKIPIGTITLSFSRNKKLYIKRRALFIFGILFSVIYSVILITFEVMDLIYDLLGDKGVYSLPFGAFLSPSFLLTIAPLFVGISISSYATVSKSGLSTRRTVLLAALYGIGITFVSSIVILFLYFMVNFAR